MTTLPITFVHGFMGDPSDWDLMRAELADYDVVTPLIKPAADWSAGVAQLADELPDRSIIVGYSMGARLSLALALSNPDACAGLVFCSGNPGIEDQQQRESRYANDCKIADRIDSDDRRDFLQHWYHESTVFKSLTARVRDDEIERKAMRTGDDWSAILRAYSVAKQPNYWSDLDKLSMPVTAIAGMQDRKYAQMISRMGSLPNIDARIVSACGHIVHREQPHVFLHLIREFLQRVE